MLSQGYEADGEDYGWDGERETAKNDNEAEERKREQRWQRKAGDVRQTKRIRNHENLRPDHCPDNYRPALWMKVNKVAFHNVKEQEAEHKKVKCHPWSAAVRACGDLAQEGVDWQHDLPPH